MPYYEKLTNFTFEIDREIVFHLIDCYPNSPIYSEVLEEYEELKLKLLPFIEPKAYLKLVDISEHIAIESNYILQVGTKALFFLASIGTHASELSTMYFEQGDYLRGMLTNAIADAYLFQMDSTIFEFIKNSTIGEQYNIVKKLDAPNNIPMILQKEILNYIQEEERINISITEGYMYTPVKTTGAIFLMEESKDFNDKSNHCDSCNSINYNMRKYDTPCITVIGRGKPIHFPYTPNISLLDSMIEHGIYVSKDCGGKGRCKKCKIKVIEGNLDITATDNVVFTDEELYDGYRLSCKAYPQKDCTIQILAGNEENFEVETTPPDAKINHSMSSIPSETIGNVHALQSKAIQKKPGFRFFSSNSIRNKISHNPSLGLAIDLGTTTLAISLFHIQTKEIIDTYTSTNRQRAYGTDVSSRIQAANEGKGILLQKSIQKDLLDGCHALLHRNMILNKNICNITLAGNTTMIHLLLGYSCKTLSSYPFTPVDLSLCTLPFHTIFEDTSLDAPVTIFPGISTFVGGDIVSGLFSLDFDTNKEVCLLIDLGTNGEIAIGNRDHIIVTSTSTGPAFEGGNISYGVAGIAGAIHGVTIKDNNIHIDTISNHSPVGICGTGVVELIAELLSHNLMDNTGLLNKNYFSKGYEFAKTEKGESLVFTQKDIREIQLAKAAIHAGIETLLHHYHISYENVSTVYLAGGFGYKLNIQKAISIGLLPHELNRKIKTVGNSSLSGCIDFQYQKNAVNRTKYIIKNAKEINLSNDPIFNDKYISNMMFA